MPFFCCCSGFIIASRNFFSITSAPLYIFCEYVRVCAVLFHKAGSLIRIRTPDQYWEPDSAVQNQHESLELLAGFFQMFCKCNMFPPTHNQLKLYCCCIPFASLLVLSGAQKFMIICTKMEKESSLKHGTIHTLWFSTLKNIFHTSN